MLVVGLTGGIGSGKTTVAKLFAEKGVTVIDADQLARDVTHLGQPALQEIATKFGSSILQKDGSLNRTALRKIVFNNDDDRIWLEKLLHPLIREEMKRQIGSAKPPYCIVVIPLLLETEKNPLIERVLIVDVPVEDQIKRTQLRDNATEEDVKAILKTQVDRAKRLALANDIIENQGATKDLLPQIERFHGFYTALALKDSAIIPSNLVKKTET